MKLICDHAGTEHCWTIIDHECPHKIPHKRNKQCNVTQCASNKFGNIYVKCIPYQEKSK